MALCAARPAPPGSGARAGAAPQAAVISAAMGPQPIAPLRAARALAHSTMMAPTLALTCKQVPQPTTLAPTPFIRQPIPTSGRPHVATLYRHAPKARGACTLCHKCRGCAASTTSSSSRAAPRARIFTVAMCLPQPLTPGHSGPLAAQPLGQKCATKTFTAPIWAATCSPGNISA